MLYRLGPTVHGRNTPVPPRPILLLMLLEGAIIMVLAGAATIITGARTAMPHAGAIIACGAGQ